MWSCPALWFRFLMYFSLLLLLEGTVYWVSKQGIDVSILLHLSCDSCFPLLGILIYHHRMVLRYSNWSLLPMSIREIVWMMARIVCRIERYTRPPCVKVDEHCSALFIWFYRTGFTRHLIRGIALCKMLSNFKALIRVLERVRLLVEACHGRNVRVRRWNLNLTLKFWQSLCIIWNIVAVT